MLAKGIVSVGDYTYGTPLIEAFDETDRLTIGKFCSFAPNVTILLGGEHRSDWISTYPFPALWEDKPIEGHRKSKGAVVIGNDVWIGQNALILSGVTIGDGAVIGAGCVVSKDVEPYAIVVGNPQRVIRKRFNDEEIAKLLELKWWDWPIERIKENVYTLCSPDLCSLTN